MSKEYRQTENLWNCAVEQVRQEAAAIDEMERGWIFQRLDRVTCLQRQLHALFLAAGGPALCRSCQGQCCDCGKNHFTLVNLLSFLLFDKPLPKPDFSSPCPFVGDKGCLLEVGSRPFNCVTFICGPIEEGLSADELQRFYRCERQLRSIYEEFDRRYAGSSPRGLLIRAGRIGRTPFLGPANT